MKTLPKLPKEREHYVLDNLNLVHHVIQKYLHIPLSNSSYQDYYQEGLIGLIQSAIRYDESKEISFSTYAVPNIRGTVLRYVREKERKLHYSRGIHDLKYKIYKYLNQGYSYKEINDIMRNEGVSERQLTDVYNTSNVMSTNETYTSLQGDKPLYIEDTIEDKRNDFEEVDSQLRAYEMIQSVVNSISNPIHKAIWEEYLYAYLYGEKLTQEYFAKKYRISQAQVSRVLRTTRKKLHEKLERWLN